jgi:hypothetical protein
MARYISRHARYRAAATAFAVLGGIGCLGAIASSHRMTLLVAGMMSFAASMLVMSLRPLKEASGTVAPKPARAARERQTLDVSIHRIGIDERKAGPLSTDDGTFDPSGSDRSGTDGTTTMTTESGASRPRERKSRTWSI